MEEPRFSGSRDENDDLTFFLSLISNAIFGGFFSGNIKNKESEDKMTSGHEFQLLNLTPHEVIVIDPTSEKETKWDTFANDACTFVVRCDSESIHLPVFSKKTGIPVFSKPIFTEVQGLPLWEDDGHTGIIVSHIVAERLTAKRSILWKLAYWARTVVRTTVYLVEACLIGPNNTLSNRADLLDGYLFGRPTQTWSGPIFTPDSGPKSAIRDEKGKIVAVSRLLLWKE